jgi:hypothetical protein
MKRTRLATKLIMAMRSLEWRRIVLIIPRQSPAEANQKPELRPVSANGQRWSSGFDQSYDTSRHVTRNPRENTSETCSVGGAWSWCVIGYGSHGVQRVRHPLCVSSVDPNETCPLRRESKKWLQVKRAECSKEGKTVTLLYVSSSSSQLQWPDCVQNGPLVLFSASVYFVPDSRLHREPYISIGSPQALYIYFFYVILPAPLLVFFFS